MQKMITGGGRILHIPDFSAIGRILAIYPRGSANSSTTVQILDIPAAEQTPPLHPSLWKQTIQVQKKYLISLNSNNITTTSKSEWNYIGLLSYNTSRLKINRINHSFWIWHFMQERFLLRTPTVLSVIVHVLNINMIKWHYGPRYLFIPIFKSSEFTLMDTSAWSICDQHKSIRVKIRVAKGWKISGKFPETFQKSR